MGIFSRLFGKNKEKTAFAEVFDKIHRILEDEQLQLEMVPPAIRTKIVSGAAYDQNPHGIGQFGFSAKNPIPVNGPVGELAYLSKLKTSSGERILFHRIGAIGEVDVFEAVTFSGSEWFLFFLDLYHPRRSKLAPQGFQFIGEVAQFSGFNNFCEQFPYDFIPAKVNCPRDLRVAYIPIASIDQQLRSGVFHRTSSHNAKLEVIAGHLTSSRKQ